MLPWPGSREPLVKRTIRSLAHCCKGRKGLRTASACGVVLRLDGRGLEIVGVDVVGSGGIHVACASSAVRHAAFVAGLIVGFGSLERVHGCFARGGMGVVYARCDAMRCVGRLQDDARWRAAGQQVKIRERNGSGRENR
jgi:hypothetical protein